jgi:hypothetical protein
MHVVEISAIPHVTWLLSLLITEGHHWVPLPMSHSPNTHTNLLIVFIQIANNKRILHKKSKELNLGCLYPVACVRSGDGVFYIRLRYVTIVG